MSNSNSDRVHTLDITFDFGEKYLDDFARVEKVGDLELLSKFRRELSDFVDSIKTKWMGKNFAHLKPHNQESLDYLYAELRQKELKVSELILKLESRNEDLIDGMSEVSPPEDVDDGDTRDFTLWRISPFYFPKHFLKKFKESN
jgi:hypothetical protein